MKYSYVLFDWGDTLMKDSPNQIASMYQWQSVQAVAGAERLLHHLSNQATIALATGAAMSDEDEIRCALARVKIDSFIQRIYCFKNTGFRKPAPEFYQHILRDLAAKPADVLMVGDSFENDVLAANREGIYAVWLNPKTDENRLGDSYWTIHSLDQLIPILGA